MKIVKLNENYTLYDAQDRYKLLMNMYKEFRSEFLAYENVLNEAGISTSYYSDAEDKLDEFGSALGAVYNDIEEKEQGEIE